MRVFPRENKAKVGAARQDGRMLTTMRESNTNLDDVEIENASWSFFCSLYLLRSFFVTLDLCIMTGPHRGTAYAPRSPDMEPHTIVYSNNYSLDTSAREGKVARVFRSSLKSHYNAQLNTSSKRQIESCSKLTTHPLSVPRNGADSADLTDVN